MNRESIITAFFMVFGLVMLISGIMGIATGFTDIPCPETGCASGQPRFIITGRSAMMAAWGKAMLGLAMLITSSKRVRGRDEHDTLETYLFAGGAILWGFGILTYYMRSFFTL